MLMLGSVGLKHNFMRSDQIALLSSSSG